MRRKETIYLEKDVADFLEKLAKENRITFSSCCSKIIYDTVTQMREEPFSSGGEPCEFSNEKIHVELRGEDAALLKRKSSGLHLTPTEWVRNVVRRKNLTIYHVKLDDLEELLQVFDRHVTVIEHIFLRHVNETVKSPNRILS